MGELNCLSSLPLSKNEYSLKVYNDVFKDILTVKNCRVIHKKRPKNLFNFIYEKTQSYRFDNIAGAVQILVEEISSKLLKQINQKYKLKVFSISGGVSDAENKTFVIVDDICDGGRTFIELAKVIRKDYSKDSKIVLIITHGIFSKGFETVFEHVDEVYTTNSVNEFSSHNKLTQYDIFT